MCYGALLFVGQQLFVESVVVHNLGHESGISQQVGAAVQRQVYVS